MSLLSIHRALFEYVKSSFDYIQGSLCVLAHDEHTTLGMLMNLLSIYRALLSMCRALLTICQAPCVCRFMTSTRI